MKRIVLLLALIVLAAVGCYQAKEPLVSVDLGQGRSVGRVQDPAPGEADSGLNDREMMQRELAKCQDKLAKKERELEECKNKCKRHEKEIERLEDKIEDMKD